MSMLDNSNQQKQKLKQNMSDALNDLKNAGWNNMWIPIRNGDTRVEKLDLGSNFSDAATAKMSGLYSDIDILTKILKIEPNEAEQIASRAKIQKLEELKQSNMTVYPPWGTTMGGCSG